MALGQQPVLVSNNNKKLINTALDPGQYSEVRIIPSRHGCEFARRSCYEELSDLENLCVHDHRVPAVGHGDLVVVVHMLGNKQRN